MFEILVQMLSIFLPTYTIYATGPVSADAIVAFLQELFIQ
jgi:hypothetical protein